MRGDIVYQVFGQHEGRENDTHLGTYRSVSEAKCKISDLDQLNMGGQNWAKKYHNKGFIIRETVVGIDFEIPPLPKPRDKYTIRASPKQNAPGTWDSTVVEVMRRTSDPDIFDHICTYQRGYSMLHTFEPFRQGKKEFALISRNYTKTEVLDLESGMVVAKELVKPEEEHGNGFCPVGFYVPDWWDVNDGSIIPGDPHWYEEDEWPTGYFGFVWGCYWGDDSSWKIQYLDLSSVQNGIIRREERFGYVHLATRGFDSLCFKPEIAAPKNSDPPPFIDVNKFGKSERVVITTKQMFNLESGELIAD